jgi:hypothetical protein
LARKFGRQLTFKAIGIGDKDQFRVMPQMVDTASDYDAKAEFCLPSLTSESIGVAFTSTVTSTIETQNELSCLATSKQRQVQRVLRESKTLANQSITHVSDADFWIYRKNDVKRRLYKEVRRLYREASHPDLITITKRRIEKVNDIVELQHADAEYVALSKCPFGEGAERFAYRFFEIAKDRRTIVGRRWLQRRANFITTMMKNNE